MNFRKYPIIIITLTLIAGILAGGFVSIQNNILFIIIGFSFFFLIIFYKLSLNKIDKIYQQGFMLGIFISSFFTGMLMQKRIDQKQRLNHYTHFIKKGTVNSFQLEIINHLKDTEKYQNYLAKVISINNYPVNGKILIKKKKNSEKLFAGQQIEGLINIEDLKEINKAMNPFSYDYRKFMNRKGIYHQIYLQTTAYTLKKQSNRLSPYYWGQKWKDKIRNVFIKNGLKGHNLQLASSLILGERQLLDPEIARDFQKAGTIHVLAISGLHIGILLLFLNFIFGFLKRRGKLKIYLFITILLLWIYAFITGFSPSVIRAVIMFSFLQIALQLRKKSSIYNSLFTAAFFMILFKPGIIYEVGFQLSLLAVLGIISFYPLFSKPIKKWKQPWKWVGDLFFVSLSAQLAILPLSLYYFHQFPVFFWLANLVVIPLLFLILFLGFSLVLLGLSEINIPFLWQIFNSSLSLLIHFNAWIAHLEYSLISHINIHPVQIAILYILLFFLYKSLKKGFKPAFSYGILMMIIALQTSVLFFKGQKNKNTSLYFLHSFRQPIIFIANGNKADIYAKDTSKINSYLIKSVQNNFSNLQLHSMPFYQKIYRHTLLNIDSMGIWNLNDVQPEYITLSHSPKINLERVIVKLKPKKVIAFADNYPSYIDRWKETCRTYNVEWINLQKGAYKIPLIK